MTTTYGLSIALPTEWVVHDVADWRPLTDAPTVNPALSRAARVIQMKEVQPDLVASLLTEVRDSSGELLLVLMASLIVYCVANEGDGSDALPGAVRRDVPIVDDLVVDLYELPVFVRDQRSGLGALATFTSPNLPLVDQLEPGFRSIAQSIRITPHAPLDRAEAF